MHPTVAVTAIAVAAGGGLITGHQIADHTITEAKLSRALAAKIDAKGVAVTLTGQQGPRGADGATGPQGTGIQGPAGVQGPPGSFAKVLVVQGAGVTVTAGGSANATASCPVGYQIIGGQYNAWGISSVQDSYSQGSTWFFLFTGQPAGNPDGGAIPFAVCAQ